MDRFYFPAGMESLIYKDCRFIIFDESDTVHTGYIEASYLGVSFSYPADSIDDSLEIHDYKVFIQSVTVDSLSSIKIGYTSINQITLGSSFEIDDRINYYHYDNNFDMILDFESDMLDAFYSFSQYQTNLENTYTISFPAPYYIALVPNPSSQINSNGFLTTSLYYRYDPNLMPILFNGDDCKPISCLYNHENPCKRYYPYDPYRGQMLLKQYRSLPKTITIGITDQSWGNTAEYYADILSRDGVRTFIENKSEKCDFSFIPIPIVKNNPTISLRYIHNLLCEDTANGYDINETINIFGNYITAAESTEDTVIKKQYFHLAETNLWNEIGVFPLYQPTIFFTANKNIIENKTDSTGFIDHNRLYKIILPERNSEVEP